MKARPEKARPALTRWFALLGILCLAACGGGDGRPDPTESPQAPQTRAQDSRSYGVPLEASLPPVPDAPAESDRWTGRIDGAAYRVEVPKNWNGTLLLWARAYWDGPVLYLENPVIRRHLLERGVAWAASSYTRNMYDVQAAIEDTNKLASHFQDIAAAHGRPLPAPRRVYVAGMSMGGHVAAAAVEAEVVEHAINRQRYDGALAMCGTITDLGWYQYLAAYQMALQYLLGAPAQAYPSAAWGQQGAAWLQRILASLPDDVEPDDRIARLQALSRQLTGGARPFFEEGWRNPSHHRLLFKLMNFEPTIDGVLARNAIDTRSVAYRFEEPGQPDPQADALNAAVLRIAPQADANPQWSTGLRWVPLVDGQLTAPVVSMHTLGDLLVPADMQRRYARRAQAAGQSARLSVRLVRDTGHCAFTAAEMAAAFDALADWVDSGRPPVGDDVLGADALRKDGVGCRFTDNRTGPEDRSVAGHRQLVQSHYPPCAGPASAHRGGEPAR